MATYIAQFVEALIAAYPTVPALRDMLLYQRDWNLDRIAPDGTLDHRVQAVISWATARGCERDLYEAALAGNSDSRELQALGPRIPNPALLSADDFEVCYVQNRAFINRKPLRKAVKRLAAPDASRLLVIDGPRTSGKSYSLFYIHHVAHRRDIQVVEIDLRAAYPGETLTADHVARDIATQMNLEEPPRSEEQAPRRIQIFCNWLAGKLRATNYTWWIVIDHCNAPLPSDVLDLIEELARRVQKAWHCVRLILVADSVAVPLVVDESAERESVELLDKIHITEFLIQFRQQIGLKDDDAEVGRILGEIMKRVDPNSPDRMSMIGRAATAQCRLMMEH